MPAKSSEGAGGFFASFYRERNFLGYLAILRIYAGIVFLMAGVDKYTRGYLNTNSNASDFKDTLIGYMGASHFVSLHWYHSFLRHTVLQNAQFFQVLITVVEIVIGVLLILGIVTRLTALIGALMTTCYYLAGAGELLSRTFIIICLVLLFSAAGRAWGFDFFLRKAWKKVPLG
jgi:uncharacterized membrane protein YphA (DoxX/SURF4 family)